MSGSTGALALAALGAGLVGATALSARPPEGPVPTLDGYFDRWQVQHHAPDVDPRRMPFVRQTLTVAYWMSRPLAHAGCLPDVLTLWGLWLAGVVVVAAGAGHRWPILAAGVAVLSAMTDAVDGCVAALTDRATRFGFVLDSTVDRVADLGLLLALARLPGSDPSPVAPAVLAGAALFLLEYTRARAGNAGIGDVGVITVGERPTRVIVAVLSLLAAGVHPERSRFFGDVGLWATGAAAAAGSLQLLWHLHRRLR
ncbi:MAG: CDP-alcohol phosphatidyltransferase family protein [Acidimicrobiales bacterium]